MAMEIPGFAYDPEKKKYFKIQPSHLTPAGSPYTKEQVNNRKLESQKRKRQDDRSRRTAKERIQRSDILRHPLLGGLGLERESGRVALSSREGKVRRGEMIAGMFERHKLVDLENVSCHGLKASICARDPLSGTIYVGVTTSGGCNLFSFRRQSQLSTYGQRPVYENDLAPFGEWVSSLSIAPSGHILATTFDTENQSDNWQIAKIPPADQSHEMSRVQYNEPRNRSTTWCSAPCTSTTMSGFAVGTSKGLATIDPTETGWSALKRGSFRYPVLAVEWMTPRVIMAGLKNSAVMFHDTRGTQSAMRLKHPTLVQTMRKVDDSRVIVNGVQSSLCIYDLRYTPAPVSKKKASQAYMKFPDYNGNLARMMDVCPELDVVACATDDNKVQLFSLTTGNLIAPFTPRSRNNTHTLSTSGGGKYTTSPKKREANHPSLMETAFPDRITTLRFDETPSLLLSSGPVVEEWKM